MGFKEEFQREMRNVVKDVAKEVHKTWKIEYKGHAIEIINEIKEEQLIIDGKIVDRNKRKYLLSHLIPYSKLSGVLELQDGTKHKVAVKLGGYVRLNCIVKIDHETILDDSQKLDFLPWDHKEKIVPYIERQIQTDHKIVDDRLPDDEYLYDDNDPRLAAGLADQYGDHMTTPFYVKKLLKLFEEQLNDPTSKTRKATYEKISFDRMANYHGEIIEGLLQAQWDESLLQREALWLLDHAAHREVVKFAITVLGCTNCEKYKERLFTIGMHEEFTSYVIFALKNGTIQANNQVWQLAKTLHGWGKIAAVVQLEAPTPEIKYWLLTEGCQNRTMNEYLAYTCAVNGELDVALYEETISKELYDGAGLIIQALLNDSIDDYSYASAVLSRFTMHAHRHCQTFEDFYPLMKISEFINEDEAIWEQRFNEQWKRHEFTSIQQAVQPFMDNPKWQQLALDALQEDFNGKALEIAQYYQLDIARNLFGLLEKYPTESELYVAVMETDNRQHIEELCIFAETHLTLSNLSTDEETCLQCIVQDLDGHEGVGLALIQAALQSDNGGLQFHALNALTEWAPSFSRQPAIRRNIENIATKTKDKEDRQLAKELLKK